MPQKSHTGPRWITEEGDPPGLCRDARSGIYTIRRNYSLGPGRGTKQKVRSLQTKSKAEALRRFDIESGKLRKEIERERRGLSGAAGDQPVTIEEQARYWRRALAEDPANAEAAFDASLEKTLGQHRLAPDEHESPFEPAREAAAAELAGLVSGARVTVEFHLEDFLKLDRRSPRYASRIRLIARELKLWLRSRPEGNTLRAISARTASEFVGHLASGKRSAKTVRALVSALSSYWSWLEERREVKANVWAGLKLPKVSRKTDMRPFTAEELKTLLSGETSQTLHDLMRLGALTGMRLNEIGNLKVRDAADGWFRVTDSKTEAGVRRVPIHPGLAGLVARRVTGKEAGDFLLEELKAPPSRGKGRADKAGERFTKYRRDRGVDDRRSEEGRSRVDFHSFRRWFVTEAIRASNRPHLVSQIVGHEEGLKGMTLGVYYGGALEKELIEVMSSVRLPSGIPQEPSTKAKFRPRPR